MHIGNISLFGALISSVATLFLSISNYKSGRSGKYSFIAYLATAGLLLVASIILLTEILSHNFQLSYVFEFSSRNLPMELLISSFFAGQEGSFLLWTLLIALLGIPLYILSKHLKERELAMFIYTLILSTFILLCILNTPFRYIWEKYPQIFPAGFLPPDGRSLNPILESIWIVTHPPFLFFGFSILFPPFALYTASYISNGIKESIALVRRWQIIGTGVLAIGLILGGLWAYESLGWGGWWGWDPVENASLIPWIIAVILLHLLLIQSKNYSFTKANFALFFIQTILIIYSTFLTRTGILQNSLHSFAGTSEKTFYVLLGAMIALLLAGVGIFIKYHKQHVSFTNDIVKSLSSSDTYTSIAMYAFLLIAIFVFFGTNFPIINPNYSIEPSFYNSINFIPLLISLILLAVAYSINRKKNLKYILITSAIIEAILIAYSISIGVRSVMDYSFILSCGFAISTSLLMIYSYSKWNKLTAITHFAFAIFMLGVIYSGNYSSSKIISLSNGESTQHKSNTITYIKSDRIEHHLKDREKYRFVTEIKSDKSKTYAMPIMFVKDRQIYKVPAIESNLLSDIYVSPLALDSIITGNSEVKNAERFTFEYSENRLMSLVWIGSFLMIIAMIIRGFSLRIK